MLERLRTSQVLEPGPRAAGPDEGDQIVLTSFHNRRACRRFQLALAEAQVTSSTRRQGMKTAVAVRFADRQVAHRVLAQHRKQVRDLRPRGIRRDFDLAFFGGLLAATIGVVSLTYSPHLVPRMAIWAGFVASGIFVGHLLDRLRLRGLLVLGLLLLPGWRARALEITIVPRQTLAENAEALAAMERAAQQWEELLQDPIQIRINADLAELSSGVIAEASSATRTFQYDTAIRAMQSDASDELDDQLVQLLPSSRALDVDLPEPFDLSSRIRMTSANAKALGLSGFGFSRLADGTINFNLEMDFDFDNSDGVGRRAVDFETTAAHEIGHVLGFSSSVDEIDAALDGDMTSSIQPTPIDLFRFDAGTGGNPESESDFTTFARSLTPGGAPILDFLDRGEVAMSSGESQGDGYQASHWAALSVSGEPIGLMQPALPNGEVVEVGPADLLVLDMVGWDYDQPPPSLFRAGDADLDLDFDQFDLVAVLQSSKYLTELAATWGEGDWNGTHNTPDVDPPLGDGVFDQMDVVAALSTGNYLTGSYAARTDTPPLPVDFTLPVRQAMVVDRGGQLLDVEGLPIDDGQWTVFTVQTVLVCEPQTRFLATLGAFLGLALAACRRNVT